MGHMFSWAPAAYFTVKKPTCCETKVSLSTGSGCLPETVHSLDRGQLKQNLLSFTIHHKLTDTTHYTVHNKNMRQFGVAYEI